MSQAIIARCTELKLSLVFFVEAFLWIALVVAVVGAVADIVARLAPLFSKQKGGYPPAPRAVTPTDPVKLIDALKGLIEALAKAPAWIAMFLAALALLWVTQEKMPAFCS